MRDDTTQHLIVRRDDDGNLSVSTSDESGKPGVLGYDPLQHLAIGLASCLLEFADRFLSRRGYPRGAELEVTWTFDARRCRVSTLRSELRLAIELDEGQRTTLERMLAQCPVHQAMESRLEVPMAVRLANAPSTPAQSSAHVAAPLEGSRHH